MLAIVTPRPALPDSIPLPIPNYSRIDSLQRTDERLAQSVYASPLPEPARQLSEYFRQFGWAASKRDPVAARIARAAIIRYLDQVRDMPEELRRLRAFHTSSFIKELRALQRNPQPSRELYELCGDFLQTMTESGWLQQEAAAPRLIVPEPVVIVMYRIRWNDIVAVNAPELRIDIDEQRLLHAFLFSHPATTLGPGYDTASRKQLDYQYLLNKIPTYARIDPDYPADYATAIVLLHLGRPEQAVAPLTAYLQRYPDGPHTLRVRNTLRYAQNQLYLQLSQTAPKQKP